MKSKPIKPGYVRLNGRQIEVSQITSVGLGCRELTVLIADGPKIRLRYDSPDDCLEAWSVLLAEIDDALASIGLPPFSFENRLRIQGGREILN